MELKNPNLREVDLEHDVVQLLVTEAVRAGMESPLREPILRAVETSTEDIEVDEATAGEHSEAGGTRRITTIAQGLVVFLVMFVVLYVSLKRLTGDDTA